MATASAHRILDYHPIFVTGRGEELIPWVRRQAIDARSEVPDIEIPESCSTLAASTIAGCSLRRRQGSKLETGVREVVDRVVNALVKAAIDQGYLSSAGAGCP